MKRTILIWILLITAAGSAWCRGYTLDESEPVSLAGIEKIVIEILEPRCVACVSTLNHDITIQGQERDRRLLLSLTGTVSTNRRGAVPRLVWEKRGEELRVSLYPEDLILVGLVSGGKAVFNAGIPAGFAGDVEVMASSNNIRIQDLSAGAVSVDTRSGNIRAEGITTENLEIACGSGNIGLDRILVSGDLLCTASSGNVTLGKTDVNGTATFSLSSGECRGDILIGGEIEINSGSGAIEIGEIIARRSLFMKASSGKIVSSSVKAGRVELVAGSGDIRIGELTGALNAECSSGNVTIGFVEIREDITISCSSGNIRLTVPPGSRYSPDIKAGSGRISLADPVLGIVNQGDDAVRGDVNGGGPIVRLRASSGNISISH